MDSLAYLERRCKDIVVGEQKNGDPKTKPPVEDNPSATAYHWAKFARPNLRMRSEKDGFCYDERKRLWQACTDTGAATSVMNTVCALCTAHGWTNRWTSRKLAGDLYRTMLPFVADPDFCVNTAKPDLCPIAGGYVVNSFTGELRDRERDDRFSIEYRADLSRDLLGFACLSPALPAPRGVLEGEDDAAARRRRGLAEGRRTMTDQFPLVMQFLMPAFCNDFEQLCAMQKVLGYALLTGYTMEKCIFWLLGPRRDNAKTSLMSVAENMCGKFLYYG